MTLPALPLYDNTTLSNRSMILLSLARLRGGSVLDYMHLDVSESVLLSMLLQAASELMHSVRLVKELDAKSQGFREGLKVGREIYQ